MAGGDTCLISLMGWEELLLRSSLESCKALLLGDAKTLDNERSQLISLENMN